MLLFNVIYTRVRTNTCGHSQMYCTAYTVRIFASFCYWIEPSFLTKKNVITSSYHSVGKSYVWLMSYVFYIKHMSPVLGDKLTLDTVRTIHLHLLLFLLSTATHALCAMVNLLQLI